MKAILSPTNEHVNIINNTILLRFNAPIKVYYLINTVLDRKRAVHYPIEFVNLLTLPRTPPHKLILNVGSPIILLWNLCPSKLLLQIKYLKKHLLECNPYWL